MSYDAIVYFRALAEVQLPPSITNKSAVGSWITWGSSWLFNQDDLPEGNEPAQLGFSSDTRSRVFSAINYQDFTDSSFTSSSQVVCVQIMRFQRGL